VASEPKRCVEPAVGARPGPVLVIPLKPPPTTLAAPVAVSRTCSPFRSLPPTTRKRFPEAGGGGGSCSLGVVQAVSSSVRQAAVQIVVRAALVAFGVLACVIMFALRRRLFGSLRVDVPGGYEWS